MCFTEVLLSFWCAAACDETGLRYISASTAATRLMLFICEAFVYAQRVLEKVYKDASFLAVHKRMYDPFSMQVR